jgi:alpha-beta hydrolase superfamily lysophospholipase
MYIFTKSIISLMAWSLLFPSLAFCGINKPAELPKWSANIRVPFRSWIPKNKPREVLLCVHGLGFSSKSFTEFGRLMAGREFAVYAMDVRGFGAWMNRKGEDRVDFEACLSDVETALRKLRSAYPSTPIFLVGESMGGAIVLRAASRNPQLVDGIVSSVPSSDRYAKFSSEIVIGAHYLADKDKPMDLKPEVLDRTTADPALRAKFEAEPTNRMKLTPKELKQFNEFMKGNNDAAALIAKTPVLMIAGFKDKLVKPEGTIELFNILSTQDKMLMIVGDSEHLLLEENQLTPQLTQLVTDWIKSELPGRQNHR